ncbi:MAG: hypothetical protein V1712_04215 [Patescibacteria group bacterium]
MLEIYEREENSSADSSLPFFKQGLEISELDYKRGGFGDLEKLMEFRDNPRYIIRSITLEAVQSQFEGKFGPLEAAQKAKGLFDELRQKYSIVAPVDFVVGKSEDGTPLLFTITEKIKGQDIEDVDYDPSKKDVIVIHFEDHYASLVRYFIDKFNSDDFALWDIGKSSAYVYGEKEGDSSDQLYLVDTDIRCEKGRQAISNLCDIFPTIAMLEEKFGLRFDTVREELRNFVTSVKDDKVWWIKQFNEFLST